MGGDPALSKLRPEERAARERTAVDRDGDVIVTPPTETPSEKPRGATLKVRPGPKPQWCRVECGEGDAVRIGPGVPASRPPEGNFNFTARAVGWEYQVDGAAELMRNENRG
jgi:hypothetical protein